MREPASLEFTGERFVPTLDGQIKYEHLHRYALAAEFVAGKSVLDIASGEGYGAALLARAARCVTGVDISPESVEHARRKYYHQNLQFLVGGCDSVPLADASVEAATSFETIEHHDRHEEMMSEIKRVLEPGGLFIISSPNRLTYSDEPGYSNPFHVKELYYDEFNGLLRRYFKHVHIYGHRLATASFVYQLREVRAEHLKAFSGDLERLTAQVCDLPSPVYFIALCSDEPLADLSAVNSIYLDGADDLFARAERERVDMTGQMHEHLALLEDHGRLKSVEEHAAELEERAGREAEQARRQAEQAEAREAEMAAVRARLSAAEEIVARRDEETASLRERLSSGERLIGKYEAEMAQQAAAYAEQAAAYTAAREQLSEREAAAREQADELSRMHERLSSQRTQLNQLALMLSETRAQLANKSALLSWMFHSRSWGITTPLRRLSLSGHRLRQRLPRRGRGVIQGYVDSPAEGGVVAGHIEVVGWAYSLAASVVRVDAFLDNMPLGAVAYGHARPDVAGAFPAQAPPDCGYASLLPLDEVLAGRRTLMVRVRDERGNFEDYTREVVVEPVAGAASFPEAALAPAGVEFGVEPRAALVDSFFGDNLSASKRLLKSMAETYLENFLLSDSTVEFPHFERPEISILLVLYNRAELTLQCLQSILNSNTGPYEVIIVDNASTDDTRFLLGRIKGARVIRNSTNLHYLRACNRAAAEARGDFILLLNNDTQVLANSVASALSTLKSSDRIGAVGGKLVLPDGTLQEAGNIVWRDGSCAGYGRGDSPSAPPYMFRRDVDYCSAAFLLTRRALFAEGGGFDEAFAPAYYEETDYCARLWAKGLRVVYDPNAVVLHYEFASSSSQQGVVELQAGHQKVFRDKHAAWLSSKPAASPSGFLQARAHPRGEGRRVLFIDDRVPHASLGSGFPRSNRIVSELVGMGHFVTLYPLGFPKEEWSEVYRDVPREVEVMLDHGAARLESFLGERCRFYDYIFVSRPHNMAALKAVFSRQPHLCAGAKVVYDAEAIFSLREIGQMRVEGKTLTPEQERKLVGEELALAENCHRIISVSEREAQEFVRFGYEHVHTLGHSMTPTPTPTGFDARAGFLFVGAIHSPTSPNADSVVWFAEEILPLARRRLGRGARLVVAGSICVEVKNRLAGRAVDVLGRVDDLTPLYDRARVFVAPTRFAAGIPHKVQEAAAHGLPVVTTPLIGSQLSWRDETELLLADGANEFADACVRLYEDGDLWARVRADALARVGEDCSPRAFAESLRAIID